MNPYREAFYRRQAEWHGFEGIEYVQAKHERLSMYYRWYTKNWLPEVKSTPVLDIGCGSGQFLYFLRKQGYSGAIGVDLDRVQVEAGRELGLDCRNISVSDHLAAEGPSYGLIAMLDILEHFTREELFPLLEAVSARLLPGGRLIVSVPNADSPAGLRAIYADITHELAFTATSLAEMLFCHGLMVEEYRDPWPAPISPARWAYRLLSGAARKVEGARMKLLGFQAPMCWSSVLWAMAVKPQEIDSPRESGQSARRIFSGNPGEAFAQVRSVGYPLQMNER